MARVLDSDSFIAPAWKHAQDVMRSRHRLKARSSVWMLFALWHRRRSVREPPPASLPVPTKKLNPAPEVLPPTPFLWHSGPA